MEFIHYLISFILILSIIVFIHEYGHYIVAKKFGVKIISFSIGFGKEIYGWNDKYGTRWKISLIPLGGYVKMYGDQDPTSQPSKNIKTLTNKEKKLAFFYKPLHQRFLIVLAGPLANYLLGIVMMLLILIKFGTSTSSNIITEVIPNLPAQTAGIEAGDRIIKIDNMNIKTFSDLQKIIQINPGILLNIIVERNSHQIPLTLTPQSKITKDFLGNEIKTGYIGIKSDEVTFQEVTFLEAIPLSVKETWDISILTLKVIKQLILGQRNLSDLSGPVRIAQYSGQVTKKSLTKDENGNRNLYLILWFIAMLSINLGLMNLLPIPVLDGGHLFLYSIEFLFRKSLPNKAQEIVFALGFSFLFVIFILVTFNDIKSIILN